MPTFSDSVDRSYFADRFEDFDDFANLVEQGLDPQQAEQLRRLHQSAYAIQTLVSVQDFFACANQRSDESRVLGDQISPFGASQLRRSVQLLAIHMANDIWSLTQTLTSGISPKKV